MYNLIMNVNKANRVGTRAKLIKMKCKAKAYKNIFTAPMLGCMTNMFYLTRTK